MLLKVIALKDTAAQAFMQPSFCHSTGIALREFADMINKPGELISKHPQDFEMYCLGSFDDTTGLFSTEGPELLSRGIDLVIKS